MGLRIFDQYSLLHFAVGVLAYFWSFSFFAIILIHILFEFIENTPVGMNFINAYFTGIGWIASYQLDKMYK